MEVNYENGLMQRKQATYKSLEETFLIANETYRGQQYSRSYVARLDLRRTMVYSLLPSWKPHLPSCTVLGLEQGKECIIFGTLYKHMKLKPSILDEFKGASTLVQLNNFLHSDDYLVLEDEIGSVKLSGGLLFPSVYVTGIVVTLHGKETGTGEFEVEDVLEAGLPHQIDRPLNSGEDKFVVFVSGLSVGSTSANPLRFQLFVDHITGHLGDLKEQGMAAQIVRVVIAGNSVEFAHGFLIVRDQSKLSEPIKELDILMSQIAAGIPVDIMPGEAEPANSALPQQPLHRCLFPGSSAFHTCRSCTNPNSFELDNVRFLGTSGQNIDDLAKYSNVTSKLKFLERTLRWRHIAPTAPNTLGCYPFTDRDPFYIETCPHVYFVGNQEKFDASVIKGSDGQVVRLIAFLNFLNCCDVELEES